MKRLAIIPSRGGSKRLPRKNLLPLGSKPLIDYTIEAVVSSKLFRTILFSSDDDEMLHHADKFNNINTEKRDKRLAGDEVKVIDLVKEIASRDDYDDYDQIGLFLPTCPFRNAEHIREAIQLLDELDYSVVSVCPMIDPLQLSLTIDERTNIINPNALLNPSPLVTGLTRSQDFEPYFRVNGGLYIAWMNQFRQKENFFEGQVKGYVMSRLESVDIDYKYDLDIANLLLEKKYIKNV